MIDLSFVDTLVSELRNFSRVVTVISELSVTYQWMARILRGAMDVSHRSVMFYLIPLHSHSHIHFWETVFSFSDYKLAYIIGVPPQINLFDWSNMSHLLSALCFRSPHSGLWLFYHITLDCCPGYMCANPLLLRISNWVHFQTTRIQLWRYGSSNARPTPSK